MYDDIRDKQISKLITVSEENIFKCELERSVKAETHLLHRSSLPVLASDQETWAGIL